MNIEEFLKMFNLKLEVSIRQENNISSWLSDNPMRYYAYFRGVDVSDNLFLTSEHGNGSTPKEAIENYIGNINGKKLTLNNQPLISKCPKLTMG